MGDAMHPDDFAERFRNTGVSLFDQAEAAKAAEREQKAWNEHIRVNSRDEVTRLRPTARDVVDRINAKAQEVILTDAADGFTVMHGREMATAYAVRPYYANEGVTEVQVNYQRMQSNFAMFGITPPESENAKKETYSPVWDTDASAIHWRRKGSSNDLSTMALVQHVLTTLQKRAA